jgi:hypothetical protein
VRPVGGPIGSKYGHIVCDLLEPRH